MGRNPVALLFFFRCFLQKEETRASMASAASIREESREIRFFPLGENPSFSGEKCSASASPASSSSSPTGRDRWRQCGSDRMLKNELDAARALADLSQMAPIDATGQDEKWGNKGRRSQKRAVDESKVVLEQGKDDVPWLGLDSSSSKLPWPLDTIQNNSLGVYEQHRNVCQHIERRSGQVDSTFPKSSLNCSRTGMSFCRGKSKQNLSEAEKEAKRLHRVLANRESARQTILRRQAFSEELTRKAADLAWDNNSMKREKELVMREYQLLKEHNKYLKIQVAKTIKGEDAEIKCEVGITTELEETPSEANFTHWETLSSMQPQPPAYNSWETLSSMQLQSPAYNRTAFMPFFSPFLYPLQTHPFPQNAIELKDLSATYMAHWWRSLGQDIISVPRMPSYMLPCPWFFTSLPHWPGPHPCDPPTCKEKDENFVDGQCNMGQSSIPRGKMEKVSFLTDGRDISSSTEAIAKQENPPNNTAEGEGQMLGMVNWLTTNTLQPISTLKCESDLSPDLDSKEAVSSGKLQETSIYQSRKLVDTSTAAEARKRRKELTKLKNHHSRQFLDIFEHK